METETRNLRKEISEKLKDETLRDALGRFSEAYPIARAKAYENAGDIETLRDALRQMKIDTVARIEEVADRFEAEATKRGARVFRAKTGNDVKEYLVNLCQEKGVKRIVKSKSMASEEIDLSKHLETAGISTTETDLGEWIVALAGQKPSHMVMPAIHLSRFQVAEYFSKELKTVIPPDIAFMVQAAHKELREKFLQADSGHTYAGGIGAILTAFLLGPVEYRSVLTPSSTVRLTSGPVGYDAARLEMADVDVLRVPVKNGDNDENGILGFQGPRVSGFQEGHILRPWVLAVHLNPRNLESLTPSFCVGFCFVLLFLTRTAELPGSE